MLKTPSKFLPRPFLRALTENRFISPRGIEYSPEEVVDLLHFKESNSALSDYARQIREHHREPPDFRGEVLKFQKWLTDQTTGILKESVENQSSKTGLDAPKLFQADTIFQLSEETPQCLDTFTAKVNNTVGASQEAPSKRRKTTMQKMSALEKSLRITATPKEIDVDTALDLLDTWLDEMDSEVKTINKELKSRGKSRSHKINGKNS